MTGITSQIIFDCIENRDLHELRRIFKNGFFSRIILRKIIETYDYDIISLLGEKTNTCFYFEYDDTLELLFNERKILELLIINNAAFIHNYSSDLMKIAMKFDDYEIMQMIGERVNLNPSLILLAMNKGVTMVKFLVDLGINITKDSNAFNKAVEKNNFTMVEYMHEAGFNIKIIPNILFHSLTIEMAEFLVNLRINASEINKLLMLALKINNANVVEYLINNGANCDKFYYTVKFDVFCVLLDNNFNIYLDVLFVSIIYFNREQIQYLIDSGADIHYNYDILLSESVLHNKIEATIILLENGADVHVESEEPLRIAVIYGYLDMIKCLVKYGADVNANNDIILKYAASKNLKIVKYFEEHNLFPDRETLIISVRSFNVGVFNYFIDNGSFTNVDELLKECFSYGEYYNQINHDRNSKKSNLQFINRKHDNDDDQALMVYNVMLRSNPSSLKNKIDALRSQLNDLLFGNDKYGIRDFLNY